MNSIDPVNEFDHTPDGISYPHPHAPETDDMPDDYGDDDWGDDFHDDYDDDYYGDDEDIGY